MSQTLADVVSFFRRCDPATRDATLAALLAERMADAPGEPVRVPGIGVVVPFGPPHGTPPVLTPAEEEEDRRRLASLDDCLSHDELLASLEAEPMAPAAPAAR